MVINKNLIEIFTYELYYYGFKYNDYEKLLCPVREHARQAGIFR